MRNFKCTTHIKQHRSEAIGAFEIHLGDFLSCEATFCYAAIAGILVPPDKYSSDDAFAFLFSEL